MDRLCEKTEHNKNNTHMACVGSCMCISCENQYFFKVFQSHSISFINTNVYGIDYHNIGLNPKFTTLL